MKTDLEQAQRQRIEVLTQAVVLLLAVGGCGFPLDVMAMSATD
jgi:hypothetical protein